MWVNKYDDAVEMGKEGRYIVVTTREEWKRDCTSNQYCPLLECMDCNEPVTTTSLNSLQSGKRIGCSCHNSRAESNMWVNRRPETVEMGQKDDYSVVTTPEEWKRDCTGNGLLPQTQVPEMQPTRREYITEPPATGPRHQLRLPQQDRGKSGGMAPQPSSGSYRQDWVSWTRWPGAV